MQVIENFFLRYVAMPFSTMQWNDILEILVFSYMFYHIVLWIKRSRAWILLRGAIYILLIYIAASILQMHNLLYVFHYVTTYIVIGAIVILQPEIRKALEQLGRQMQMTHFFNLSSVIPRSEWYSEKSVEEIVRACANLGRAKTGALIILERNILLDEYIETGIGLNADITSQLLEQIFERNTPLHDGAIIIRENKILAATCYLPLSENRHISKELGTRHRAGLGISEVCDCITVIVSEETGGISAAIEGKLYRGLDENSLRKTLQKEQSRRTDAKESAASRKGAEQNEQ